MHCHHCHRSQHTVKFGREGGVQWLRRGTRGALMVLKIFHVFSWLEVTWVLFCDKLLKFTFLLYFLFSICVFSMCNYIIIKMDTKFMLFEYDWCFLEVLGMHLAGAALRTSKILVIFYFPVCALHQGCLFITLLLN